MGPSTADTDQSVTAAKGNRWAKDYIMREKRPARAVTPDHDATMLGRHQPALHAIYEGRELGALASQPDPLQAVERHAPCLCYPKKASSQAGGNPIGTSSSGPRRIGHFQIVNRGITCKKLAGIAGQRRIGLPVWIEKHIFDIFDIGIGPRSKLALDADNSGRRTHRAHRCRYVE